tara:strand:- start:1191 stop:1718 length:528 start_codon:yes stop_codon:yes gene_type:complete
MEIYTNPYETLHIKSDNFDFSKGLVHYDNDLEKFQIEMIGLMETASGIGLAANQVGITKRFFAIGNGRDFKTFANPIVVWNPEVVESSEEQVIDIEGCLSFPDVWVEVKRPKVVTVKWQDITGKEQTAELDNIESKCFQHECDHLDGITFNKRVSKLKWDMAKKKSEKIKKELGR